MKVQLILTSILSITLASCAVPATLAPTTRAPDPPLALTAVQTTQENTSSCSQTVTPVSGTEADYAEPDPETWVMLMKPVREYFYYRKKAVIAGDVQILWDRYPTLKQGADFPTGLNAEAFFIENMKGLKPFDGNIFPEHYERIKVMLSAGQAQVLVHEMELYLYADESGQFDDSGGEFKIILFLCSEDNHQWTVYKTHDISGP
jgi:hypothetical protein